MKPPRTRKWPRLRTPCPPYVHLHSQIARVYTNVLRELLVPMGLGEIPYPEHWVQLAPPADAQLPAEMPSLLRQLVYEGPMVSNRDNLVQRWEHHKDAILQLIVPAIAQLFTDVHPCNALQQQFQAVCPSPIAGSGRALEVGRERERVWARRGWGADATPVPDAGMGSAVVCARGRVGGWDGDDFGGQKEGPVQGCRCRRRTAGTGAGARGPDGTGPSYESGGLGNGMGRQQMRSSDRRQARWLSKAWHRR